MLFEDIKIPKGWKKVKNNTIERNDKVIAIRYEYKPFGGALVVENPRFWPSQTYNVDDAKIQSSINKLVNKYKNLKTKDEVTKFHTSQPFVFGPRKVI